uniref:Uncharacterized protein n=1 Tax=Musca domestica TaxID=7370 RepID=A0A1I8MJS5_MUSDO
MAPAQRLEQAESATRYSHKKFQGNRYAHKKFGTRTPSPPVTVNSYPEGCQETELKFQSNKDESIASTTIKKSCSADIFRPYALGDNTPRKRKHQDVVDNDEEIQNGKRFAITSPIPQPTSVPMGVTSPSLAPPPPPRFIFGAQPMQFNPQTFALMFQKQHAALCMGQMLKRLT